MLTSLECRFGSLKLNGISFGHLRQLVGDSQVALLRNDPEIVLWRRLGTERATSQTRPILQNGARNGGSCNRNQDGGMRPGPPTSATPSHDRRQRKMDGAKVSNVVTPRKKLGGNQVDCIFCGKIYTYWSRLEVHMTTHTKEQSFDCTDCGSSFLNSSNFWRHKISLHSNTPKRFPCQFCDKHFHCLAGLEDHTRRHVGEKPFECPVCGKSFVSQGNLWVHKMIHSGQKLHRCNICLKTFRQIGHLEDHTRRHTGERPFKCSSCPLAFHSSQAHGHHLKATGHIKA